MANRAALEKEIDRVRADLARYKAENKEDTPKISSQESHLASLLKCAAVPPSEAELEAAEVRKELAGLEHGTDFKKLAEVRTRLAALDEKVSQEEIAGGIPGQPDDDVPDGSSPPARGTRSPNEPPMHTRPSEGDTAAVRAEIARLEAEIPSDGARIAAAKARLKDMESRAQADDKAAATRVAVPGQRVTPPAFQPWNTPTEQLSEPDSAAHDREAGRDQPGQRVTPPAFNPDSTAARDREIASSKKEIARLEAQDPQDGAKLNAARARLADMERSRP